MLVRKDLLEKLIDMANVSVEFLNAKDDEGKWITIKGNHIFIKKGQTEKEAFDAFLSKVENKDSKKVTDKTQTKEFKEWFDNSKVVDKDGKPLVVYHGTDTKFESFDESKIKRSVLGYGFNFTADKNTAKEFNPKNVMEVYLDIKKPFILSKENISDLTDTIKEYNINKIKEYSGGNTERAERKIKQYIESGNLEPNTILSTALENLEGEDFTEFLKEKGFDGIIAKYPDVRFKTLGGDTFVAFKPEQIKSINNKGEFDKSDKNIYNSIT